MEDISLISSKEVQKALEKIKGSPISSQGLRTNLDRIYMISSYNQSEYLPDVYQSYSYLKLGNSPDKLALVFNSKKDEKYFYEEYISTSIRYMIICRKFKQKQLMVLTQQMMIQGLKIFMKNFENLQKFPKLITILRIIFDSQKQFYRLNYSISYFPLFIPKKQQNHEDKKFMDTLKIGDKVDALKVEETHRICWLPAEVIELGENTIQVGFEFDAKVYEIQKSPMMIRPFGSKKEHYEWRFCLQQNDKVDYQKSQGVWSHSVIKEMRYSHDGQDLQIVICHVRLNNENWIPLISPKIQRYESIVKGNNSQRFQYGDFNDILFDPKVEQPFVLRSQNCKSLLFLDMLNYGKEINLFQTLVKTLKREKISLSIVSDIIQFIAQIQPFFHRLLALQYLQRLKQILECFFIENKDLPLKLFSQQKLSNFLKIVEKLFKRLSKEQVHEMNKKITFNFLQQSFSSDYLNRKMQSILLLSQTIFHDCEKQSKKTLFKDKAECMDWLRKNKVIQGLFSNQSHIQIIKRSKNLIKLVLKMDPTLDDLQPIINNTSDGNLELVNSIFDKFPQYFKEAVVSKINRQKIFESKSSQSILSKYSLSSATQMKGDWKDIVYGEQKGQVDIETMFQCPLSELFQKTTWVKDLYECRFKKQFFIYLNRHDFLISFIRSEELSVKNKIVFISIFLDMIKVNEKFNGQVLELIISGNNIQEEGSFDFLMLFLEKFTCKQLRRFYEMKFGNLQRIEDFNETDIKILKKCFVLLNQKYGKIQKGVIKSNINKMIGVKTFLQIIKKSQNIEIALHLLEYLKFKNWQIYKEYLGSQNAFLKSNFKKLVTEIVKLSDPGFQSSSKMINQEKHLKMILSAINENESSGGDLEPCINTLYPDHQIELDIVDNFSMRKKNFRMRANANWTLFQLRYEIGQEIKAYFYEMKLINNEQQMDFALNGFPLHQLSLSGSIFLQKYPVQKIQLTDHSRNLVKKLEDYLKSIFRQYSHGGEMSKLNCQKYRKKCLSFGNLRGKFDVGSMFIRSDRNRGTITEQDFIAFYKKEVSQNENMVWAHLQIFGIRQDLSTYQSKKPQYRQKNMLLKNNLPKNSIFMNIIFKLLKSEEQIANVAWKILRKLTIRQYEVKETNFENSYTFLCWLAHQKWMKNYDKISREMIVRILQTPLENVIFAFQLVQHSSSFDEELFITVMAKIQKLNQNQHLKLYDEMILKGLLKVVYSQIKHNPNIQTFFKQNHKKYIPLLKRGILSKDIKKRKYFCQFMQELLNQSDTHIFQLSYHFIYQIFINQIQPLTLQFYQLFENLLKNLYKCDETTLQKVQFKENDVAKNFITILQKSITNQAQQIVQKIIQILTLLVNESNSKDFIFLISKLFSENLFSAKVSRPFKKQKTRISAFTLIQKLCYLERQLGIRELFKTEFKSIWLKQLGSQEHSPSKKKIKESRYPYISNIQATSYLSSVLSQLFMITPFKHLVFLGEEGPENIVKKGNQSMNDNLLYQLKVVFGNLQLSENQEFAPDSFCFSWKDSEGRPLNTATPKDASQYLFQLIFRIQNSFKNTPLSNSLRNLFSGIQSSMIICKSCGKNRQIQQHFNPFILQVTNYKNIQESLNKYFQNQVLMQVYCDNCQQKTEILKKNSLSKMPEYLIIQPQRTKYNYGRLEVQKIHDKWQFSKTLNMERYMREKEKKSQGEQENLQYTLKGVIIHYGSVENGHYYTIAKGEKEQLWYEFNEGLVREFNYNNLQKQCFGGNQQKQYQSAHILFYERRKKTHIELQFEEQGEKVKFIEQFGVKIDDESNKDRVDLKINIQNIPICIPNSIRQKIWENSSELRDQINRKSEEFMNFAVKIMKMDPSEENRLQYLQFYLGCMDSSIKMQSEENQEQKIGLCQFGKEKFGKQIKGCGWRFLKNGQVNWQKDILHINRSSRQKIGMFLKYTISDIVLNNLQTQSTKKSIYEKAINDILYRLMEMRNQYYHPDYQFPLTIMQKLEIAAPN